MKAAFGGKTISFLSRVAAALTVLGMALLLTSCAYRIRTGPVVGGFQTGIASWYGPDFHGKTTSNREIYDMFDMTAAHRTLPFGTFVMVTNLNNRKSAIVRINDRGPFVGDRIIDLSYAAARLLEMIGSGTAPVRLEILKTISASPPQPGFSVQIGSFSSLEKAEQLKTRLKPKYDRVEVSPFKTPSKTFYRVRIKASDRDAAMRAAQLLSEEGYPVLILEDY